MKELLPPSYVGLSFFGIEDIQKFSEARDTMLA
jgi:hypothetical protein